MSKLGTISALVAIVALAGCLALALSVSRSPLKTPNGTALGRSGQVFVMSRGMGNRIIAEFDAKQGQKIRLTNFGITSTASLTPKVRQVGNNILIDLPGGQQLWVLNTALADLPAKAFQLELDRIGLVKTFGDEFDSFSWDSEKANGVPEQRGTWRTNFGYRSPVALDSRTLIDNNELEVYSDPGFRGTSDKSFGIDPFRVSNGVLEISAAPAPEEIRPLIWNRRYTSGLITTHNSFSQRYGVFEMRARLPKGRGLWPAFWLLLPSGAWPPEIDVFEVLGDETTTLHTSWHTLETGSHTTETIATPVPDLSADFHTFTFEWDKDEIAWYFDGAEVARRPTPRDMHRPMYVLANLAVGGGWPKEPDASTRFPAIFAIDWIRVYRRTESPN